MQALQRGPLLGLMTGVDGLVGFTGVLEVLGSTELVTLSPLPEVPKALCGGGFAVAIGLMRLEGRCEEIEAEGACLRVCLGMYSMQASGADLLTQREHGWPPGQDFLEVAQGWHFRRGGAGDLVVGARLRE